MMKTASYSLAPTRIVLEIREKERYGEWLQMAREGDKIRHFLLRLVSHLSKLFELVRSL